MIVQIEGRIVGIENKGAVIMIGGVGLLVFTTPDTLSVLHSAKERGDPARLYTYLSVREDALDLYGFIDRDERSLFELIIGISGIGPKKALTILAAAPAATLRRSILGNDATYLTKVSGIGKKIADKILLELKDKVVALGGDVNETDTMNEDKDALSALMALGYSREESRQALKGLPIEITGLNSKIKEALKHIGKS